jgi:hypothetical protein
MYKVTQHTHPQYGNVVEVTREYSGEYQLPHKAFSKVCSLRQAWLQQKQGKIRILIDGQILTKSQAEAWANAEYKSLPKCAECLQPLEMDTPVQTHSLGENKLFCTQTCADKDYLFQMEKMNDNEEHDCDL